MSFLGNASLRFEGAVGGLSIDPILRFRIIRAEKRLKARFNAIRGCAVASPKDYPLVPSNLGYGHEHWLKEYAGYDDDILATIEHGVYFGDQSLGYGNPIREEWQIGSFLTYGDYRRRLLEETYPNNRVFMIGPYISYAKVNEAFKEEIVRQLDPSERTLTLFPAHSAKTAKRRFDHDSLIEHVCDLAHKADCKNLVACLSPMDINAELSRRYQEKGYIVISCGNDLLAFLSRQKAIFSVSDVTVSNDLGTHVGYSIAMGVPHFIVDSVGIDVVDPTLSDLDVDVLAEQKRLFSEVFSPSQEAAISEEQRSLVDHYWGCCEHKSPAELRAILRECAEYGRMFADRKDLWVQKEKRTASCPALP